MNRLNPEVEALKRMQRDTAEGKARRQRHRPAKNPVDGQASDIPEEPNGMETQAAQDAADETPDGEKSWQDQHFADQLAHAVKQLEDAAREYPALALLAAFTTGVVVGNLFSKR
jgi:hypothetical protein